MHESYALGHGIEGNMKKTMHHGMGSKFCKGKHFRKINITLLHKKKKSDLTQWHERACKMKC